MRFQVGRRPEGVEDVTSALVDCHGRIRSVTAVAARLGSEVEADDVEVTEAATRVARYFSEALPHHEADEEESLRPRLVGRSVDIDAALDAMTAQHQEMHAFVDSLVELTAGIASDPSRRGDLEMRRRLAEVVTVLEGIWDRHLDLEETVLFPAITDLDDATQAAIRAEMRARR